MEKNKGINRKLNIFILLLAGLLMSCMAALMYIGGSLNFREFLDAGRVYDFSEQDLKTSNGSWQYSQEEQGYRIQKQKALKKWKIDGKESTWSFLYLQVEELSVPGVETHIYYLNKNQEKVAEQIVWLTQGENVIVLECPDIKMYRMGLKVYGIKGEFISITSMQLREKANGFFWQRFLKITAAAYVGFLIVCAVLFYLKRRLQWHFPKGQGKGLEVLQFSYRIFLENACKRNHERTTTKQRKNRRRLLFSLLFLWMTTANLAGWIKDPDIQRFYMLTIVLLMIAIIIQMWEKPLHDVNWREPLSLAWTGLWILVLVSDCIVGTELAGYGAVMLLIGGCFIFVWNNQRHPEALLYEIMQALEIDFGIAVLFCMFFRTKKLTIRYNGLFPNSEEFSLYAVLMLAVFLAETDRLIRKKGSLRGYIFCITGAAISFYFVLRASHESGYAAAITVLMLFGIRQIRSREEWTGKLEQIIRYGILAGITAFVCVCVVHFSTKYLPGLLQTELVYENEIQISNVPPEKMAAFEELQPGLMDGVISAQNMEYGMKWKNYLRRLGLFGKREQIRVHRKIAYPYNGYIQMAYQYGIFVLLPYIVLQICMMAEGISDLKKRSTMISMWLLMMTVIFICFCVFGTVESMFGHPFWFCYYIGMGYWFAKEPEKILSKKKRFCSIMERNAIE